MALNFQCGKLTIPGGTGNADLTLPANFDPKIIRLYSSGITAVGTATPGSMAVGMGTYRGSSVQQFYCSHSLGNLSDMEVHTAWGTASLLMWGIPPTTTTAAFSRECEIDLVSMTSGSSSKVTLNWVDLPPANTHIYYEVWGGSDITDALVGTFNISTAGATQDVTITSGFGQPDLVMLLSPQDGTTARESGAGATSSSIMLGWFKSSTARRGMNYRLTSESAAGDPSAAQLARTGIVITNTAITYNIEVSATASWPTDGFELTYSATPAAAHTVGFLAIKGTFQSIISAVASPTGTPPVAQNLAAGFGGAAIRGVTLWGWNQPAGSSLVNSGATALAWNIGSGDGTNQVCAGEGTDDAATTIEAYKNGSDIAIFRQHDGQDNSLTAQAVHSFSGDNVALSWTTVDPQEEFNYLIVGDSLSAPVTATVALAAAPMTLSASATFSPGTKTASASLGIKGQTLSASATFAPGTKTATASLNIKAQTLSASAQHVPPTYTVIGALSIGAQTLAATALFSAGTRTATVSLVVAPQTLSASVQHVAPTYTAIAALGISPMSLAASSLSTEPTYTANVTLQIAPLTLAATAQHITPVYVTSVSLNIKAMTLSASAISAAAVYAVVATLTTKAMTLSASAQHIRPTYTTTVALAVAPQQISAVLSFTAPVYTVAAGLTLPRLTLSASATFREKYTAAVGLIIAPQTLSASATFREAHVAIAGLIIAPIQLNASVTIVNPIYTAVVSLIIAPMVLEAFIGIQVVPPSFVFHAAPRHMVFTAEARPTIFRSRGRHRKFKTQLRPSVFTATPRHTVFSGEVAV